MFRGQKGGIEGGAPATNPFKMVRDVQKNGASGRSVRLSYILYFFAVFSVFSVFDVLFGVGHFGIA